MWAPLKILGLEINEPLEKDQFQNKNHTKYLKFCSQTWNFLKEKVGLLQIIKKTEWTILQCVCMYIYIYIYIYK